MNQREKDEFARGCHVIDEATFKGFACRHVGVAMVTHVVTRQVAPTSWEARVGVALFGMTNHPEGIPYDSNPFNPDFNENYCKGIGVSEAMALMALAKDMEKTSKELLG